MIYDIPDSSDEIRQGDIFKCVPRTELLLRSLYVLDATPHAGDEPAAEGAEERDWVSLVTQQDAQWPVPVVTAVRPVFGIVITQDCDAVRSPDISLCEIRPFIEIEPKFKDLKDRPAKDWKPDKWVGAITQHSRLNQKWYYLPPAPEIGFDKRMGVDFRTVLRVQREDLEVYRSNLRIARLKDVPLAHFRERIAEFFRRYPYDEWYPLDKDELAAYQKASPEPIEPFPWQNGSHGVRTSTAEPVGTRQPQTPDRATNPLFSRLRHGLEWILSKLP